MSSLSVNNIRQIPSDCQTFVDMDSPADSLSANPFQDPTESPPLVEQAKELPKAQIGAQSITDVGQPSIERARPREKKRVGFTGGMDGGEVSKRASSVGGVAGRAWSPQPTSPISSPPISRGTTPSHSRAESVDDSALLHLANSHSHLPEISRQAEQEIRQAFDQTLLRPERPAVNIPKPRPAIRRGNSTLSVDGIPEGEPDGGPDDDSGRAALRKARAKEAFERGKRLEQDEKGRSEPPTGSNTPEKSEGSRLSRLRPGKIEMTDLPKYDFGLPSEQDSEIQHMEAFKLVRKHTIQDNNHLMPSSDGYQSGMVTPTEDQFFMDDYMPQPEQYRGGILGSLLKLYGQPSHQRSSSVPRHGRSSSAGFSEPSTPTHSPPGSGSTTPNGNRWFMHRDRSQTQSSSSLAHLIGSSASLASPSVTQFGEQVNHKLREHQDLKAAAKRRSISQGFFGRLNRSRLEDEARITVDIAETIRRQKYLIKLCRGLMLYGAPTHRLEEYMNMSARTLKIQAQFLYIPGSMIMSFDDPSTHTTEVKLVRVNQGLDLGKLRDVHGVYKRVVHSKMSPEEAIARLKVITDRKDKFSRWTRIPVYGLAAVCVGPFAFGARLIDLPVSFLLGCILGLLQLVVAPASDLYRNVFEISATVITSFLARAFGSINDGNTFCFAALAQSSIALILPGYTVLCASLELQSRSIVAGSVRMVYAIIYSLFLGYGITIGSAIYGMMDKNATSDPTCKNPMSAPYFFPFVPAFAMCLVYINQAKWKQAPMMVFIASVGYIVNFYSSKRFQGNTQVSNTLAALAIGVMANMYSRVGGKLENWLLDVWEDTLRPYWRTARRRILRLKTKAQRMQSAKELEAGDATAKDNDSIYVRQTRRVGYGLAAAAMLPAIFVQVPSGLSVSGSLVAGIASANQISGNGTNGTTVANATTLETTGLNSVAFTVGYSVIQVAIGITVGLFLSAIVVYPLGKKRSGLFSF